MASTSTVMALCSSVSILIYHLFQIGQKQQQQRISPGFITLDRIGRLVPGSNSQQKNQTISPPSLISSPSPSSVSRERHDRQQGQQHQHQQEQQPYPTDSTLPPSSSGFSLQPALSILQKHDAKEAAPPQQARSLYNTARTHSSSLEVVPGETLKSLETENNSRIWDHIVIGEGRETLQSACQIAQQNPMDSVLVIVQEDIQLTTVQRIVQWAQQLVAVQAQRLWEREALGALLELQQDHILGRTNARLSSSTLQNKTKPLDPHSLPSNVYIGSGLCATKILIDKSVTTQMALHSSPKPAQVRRFSSVGGSPKTNLTINTTPPVPARMLGLEVVNVKNLQGPCCQALCKNNVVFTTDEHPIIRSLSSNTTPPISRESTAERCATSDMSDDTSRWPRILLSVRMQHIRHDKPRTLIARLTHWSVMASQQLLASLLLALRQLVGDLTNGSVAQHNDRTLDLQPVVIHQSDRVFQHGRIRQRQEDDSEEETLRLDISASRTSLDISAPIQILVSVFSQPIPQDAFGNADIIRKSEAVLLEGLVLAKDLAQATGWSCLEEDDSQMVEWVRDQMDIQWIMENGNSPGTLVPVCTFIEGVKTYAQPLSSNSSTRVRTPNLSPYASRTTSYQGKSKNEGLGIKNIGDTALERPHNASESLQSMKSERHGCAENTRRGQGQSPTSSPIRGSPKVTIATVGAPSALRKTSFGGFSSLNDARTQTMVLAEKTEDHLGMALSLGSPLGVSTSVTPIQDSIGAFDDGVTSLDFGGTSNSSSASSPPEPKKLSRFSIKTYQLERSNHGLSDEWGIGGFGLNASVSSAKKDVLPPTSPLTADHAFPGNASSPGPSIDTSLQKNFLEYSDPLVGRKTSTQTPNSQHKSSHDSEGDEPPKNQSLGSNIVDNGNRRRYGSRVGSFSNVSGIGSGSGTTSSFSPFSKSRSPSPLRVTAELVPDFLGDSFAMPKSIVSQDEPDSTMERTQSCPSTGSTKVVHFAETKTRDVLSRAKSDQVTPTATSLTEVNDHSSLEITRPLLSTNLSSSSILSSCSTSSSSSSATSRSKAHTRRSWGKGIGGSDILGIQGLSE